MTDSRIAAAMLAAPRASWRTVGRVLGISERTVVRRAAPLFGDGTLRATAGHTHRSHALHCPAPRLSCPPTSS
ncbi:hypothetical protein [Streptomyces barringtoniae]|uniref:hypothetical protein n=1 Tax=Streptomyces barringtoniae TaxID=2892029 RepID=UPI001E62C19C|nr:hypothetical protein [Streptomyces barringtoniae]MCC5479184.1 hypothetical protein [Streptomyces barringtoniae]